MARKKVTAILKPTLKMILASARDSHPNEFACALRGEEGVITELMLVPGTLSGNRSAILRLHMLPIDFSIVGTAHSHPTRSPYPSEADLNLFSRYGPVHIIAHYPYDMDSWQAFDKNGGTIKLKVI